MSNWNPDININIDINVSKNTCSDRPATLFVPLEVVLTSYVLVCTTSVPANPSVLQILRCTKTNKTKGCCAKGHLANKIVIVAGWTFVALLFEKVQSVSPCGYFHHRGACPAYKLSTTVFAQGCPRTTTLSKAIFDMVPRRNYLIQRFEWQYLPFPFAQISLVRAQYG